jgi:heme/copper-type cytochrome/quinol oxidase subunit 1
MYTPLSSAFSPGIRSDFWLLGIGFIEISANAGAIEIIVGVLRTRAPGMSLDKLPVFSWAMLVVAIMMVLAFPSIIISTMLLELERAQHWPHVQRRVAIRSALVLYGGAGSREPRLDPCLSAFGRHVVRAK